MRERERGGGGEVGRGDICSSGTEPTGLERKREKSRKEGEYRGREERERERDEREEKE